MPVEAIMPFTFAAFFICSVKGLTNVSQRTCVNLLLKGILSKNANDGGEDVLSDSDCSNYVKGKRKLNVEIQLELDELETEAIISRLKGTGVRDFVRAAGALRTLIIKSSLSDKEKNGLLKDFQTDRELIFIAKAFQRCIKEDNSQPLSKAQVTALGQFKEDALSGDKEDTTIIHVQGKLEDWAGADPREKTGNEEDIEWMKKYLPASMLEKNFRPSDREVVMRHEEIKLPEEYPRLVYLLRYALLEANIRKGSMEAFIDVLDIDAANNSLREGWLEYWQFEGKINVITELFQEIDFSDACGFVLQSIGAFEISQTDRVEKALKVASNENVAMCAPLIYKDVPEFKLILLVHRSKKKAEEQRLDTAHDHTKIYERKRKLPNGHSG